MPETTQQTCNCNNCGDVLLTAENRCLYGGEYYCLNCFDENYEACLGCDDYYSRDDMNHADDGGCYCDGCFEERNSSQLYKENAENIVDINALTETDNFNVFGFEVEANVKEDFKIDDYEILKHFQIVNDGSLGGDGKEFVSVPIPYSKADLIMTKFGEFAKGNLGVDRKTGLHLHIFIHPTFQTADNLKKILLAYKQSEQFWFKMVSPSRRNNGYCTSLRYIDSYDFRSKATFDTFKTWYYGNKQKALNYSKIQKGFGKRYEWVNFHSVFFRNTFEIRLHQGTTNSQKMLNWLEMHKNFLKGVIHENYSNLETMDENRFLSMQPIHLREYYKQRVRELKNREDSESIKEESSDEDE